MKTQTVKTDWNIKDLEKFFENTILPQAPITLNPVCVITNVKGFISFTLDILRVNEGKETFLPYLKRLQGLKAFIEKSKVA